MQRREPPRPNWPQSQVHDPAPGPTYAPETALLAGATPGPEDEEVRAAILGLPDGAGPPSRIGICNAQGKIYREVGVHGPLQLLYLWAGLNALGYGQRTLQERGISRYCLVFGRIQAEKTAAERGRKQVPSG